LKLFLPVTVGDLPHWTVPNDGDCNVFASLSLDHTSTVADVASSSAEMDREKLFYHEAVSCMARSPLEFATCRRNIPGIFVSSGFDLAIDDCHFHDANHALKSEYYKWSDYGQCNKSRFDATTHSPWWHRHRTSLAARQLFAYERGGLGWSFSAWKLYGDYDAAADGDTNDDSVIDMPAKLLALNNVAAAGLFPSLTKNRSNGGILAADTCLNPPVADFGLGDDTIAPTPAPPPDCGNGWWNATIRDCSYWIPPPPTDAPTPCPSSSYAEPIVQECNVTAILEAHANSNNASTAATAERAAAFISSNSNSTNSNTPLYLAAGAGALVAILLNALVNKVFGRNRNRAAGYSEIPSHNKNTR
jgi:hypothetical protein